VQRHRDQRGTAWPASANARRGPASKIVTIPNGIDVRRFAAVPDHSMRSKRFPEANRILLAIGRLSADKNIHLTVQALGLLKQRGELPGGARLIIVGMVQEPAAQRLIDDAIAADGLRGTVIQDGPTSQPEAYYHGCDACIVFSSPPINRPVKAAQRHSGSDGGWKPVIASDNANGAGVVREGINGWTIPTHDVTRLAARIKAVIALPDDALQAMRGACYQTAQGFSVEQMVGGKRLCLTA